MTEIRKKLITLLEPYMDKTLSYGCLFQYFQEWEDDLLYFCSIYEDFNETHTLSYLSPSKEMTHTIDGFNTSIGNKLKIIGNYDMTAVLKYVNFKIPGGLCFDADNNIIYITGTIAGREVFEIQNKPLHLYTEEEDKILYNKLLLL